MCTYATVTTSLTGSAKAPGGRWQPVTDAVVYFDHPVHAMADHTVNIDLSGPSFGPAERIALELPAASARELVRAIEEALAAAPEALTR